MSLKVDSNRPHQILLGNYVSGFSSQWAKKGQLQPKF